MFSTIKQVSEINERLYESAVRPGGAAPCRTRPRRNSCACCTQCGSGSTWSRTSTRPSRCYRWSPTQVRQHRHPASEDNNFLQLEHAVSNQVIGALNFYRDLRDSCVEQMVKFAYGPMGLGAFFPPEPPLEAKVEKSAEEQAKAELAALRGEFERGGFLEASRPDVDRRDQEARRHRPPLIPDRR